MIKELFDMIGDALREAREVAAKLEALQKRLESHPEFDDSSSASAEKTINEARGE